VLSTPPAFVLSQDQTLQQKPLKKTQLHKKWMPKPPHNMAVTQTNLALAYKHPVEFSKNKHTPHTPHPHKAEHTRGNSARAHDNRRQLDHWDSTTGRREQIPVSPGACRSLTLPLSGGAAKSIKSLTAELRHPDDPVLMNKDEAPVSTDSS
jgi:hypothetical protein